MKDDKVYIHHIIDSINKVENYLSGYEKDDFLDDQTITNDAVVRNIEIIGEAARNISTELKQKHPEILWPVIIGMRNKIIHEYFMVDYLEVWNTSMNDLPVLRNQLEAILNSEI